MTVIVWAPGSGPESLALSAALEAGLGSVQVVHQGDQALASLLRHPRAALVLDLREAEPAQLEQAARLRSECPAVANLVLLARGQPAPPRCDAVFRDPVFLEDVVRWCIGSRVPPLAEGLLEDLAAGLCHEIGNPLTSLFLQLELLRTDEDLESMRSHLARIEESARRIQGVVRDVAQAAERRPVQLQPASLAGLLAAARRQIEARHPDYAERIRWSIRDARVALDVELLGRALADLMEYLLHAGDPEALLQVEAEPREAPGPCVRLSTTASRLPDDAAGRLFTPLWARQALGLPEGLSLTSARNAFLRHRGDLLARTLPDGRLQLQAWLPAGDQGILSFPT